MITTRTWKGGTKCPQLGRTLRALPMESQKQDWNISLSPDPRISLWVSFNPTFLSLTLGDHNPHPHVTSVSVTPTPWRVEQRCPEVTWPPFEAASWLARSSNSHDGSKPGRIGLASNPQPKSPQENLEGIVRAFLKPNDPWSVPSF